MTYLEEFAPVWVCEVLALCDDLAAQTRNRPPTEVSGRSFTSRGKGQR